ncbi:MAG: hypothetical protein COB16_05095 [Rhodobacteraceae bacterium]|nr:MAG: hypothetical protein COB16_05095 [Paracoccaceae bacterium]
MNGVTIPRHAHALSQDQTIAAIYETVIRAELCDRFLRAPEVAVSGFSEAAPVSLGQAHRINPDLQLHFARATEILEQQWIRSGRPAPEQFFDDNDQFWILLTASGKVARASRLARAFFQETGGGAMPVALGLGDAAQDRIEQRLAQLRQQKIQGLIPEVLATPDQSRKLMCRSVQCGQGLQASYGLMIEALDFQWSSRAQDMLSATFGLHRQEVQLLGGILEGNSLSELANPTRGGISSLKVQLRVIMAKSGAPGLEEMLRLFCFLIAEVASDDRIASGEVAPPEGRLDCSDDQCLQFYKLGADTGQPVIFLHGLLDGIAGVQRLQSQFRKRGFRVYAPLRCGYGQSGPVPSSDRSIDVFIDQLETLIVRENLQRPIILGHRGGAAFAHIAARRLRDRVAGAVIVSGMGPVQKLGHLSALKGHHWIMAVAATYSPRLLPLVVKLWARSIRQHGPMVLLRQKPQPGNKNGELTDGPQLTALLQASHNLSLLQEGAGLMADFHWIVNDWQRHIDGYSAPVIYLHGDDDQVTSVDRLQRTMTGRSNVQVRLCRGGGPMLLYSRPELVFAALEELADR